MTRSKVKIKVTIRSKRYDTVYLRALKSWRDGQLNLAHGTETKKRNGTGFRERCNFEEDEAKISSRVGGVKWRVVYFDKLVFESDEQEFSLRGIKKISSHSGRDLVKSVLKKRNAWAKIEWGGRPRSNVLERGGRSQKSSTAHTVVVVARLQW